MKKWHAVLMMMFVMLMAQGAAQEETTRIRLTFAGDVTLGSEEYLWGKSFSLISFERKHGQDYFFEKVRPLFEQDDLTIVNLEGVLSDSAEDENKEKTYRFRGPSSFAGILAAGNVEAVNLANNHSLDYGERGYKDTQKALRDAGVAHFGHRQVMIYEKGEIRIAFLALSYTQENAEERAWLDQEIRRLKEEGVNAVIFSYHGGQEYSEARTKKQQEIARLAVDAGADLVVMHHPHVVQGMSVLDNRSVLYSLGNFCFGGNKNVRAMESLVAVAELSFLKSGAYLGQQITLYPAHISGTQPRSNYQPSLVGGKAAERVMRLVQADTRFELAPFDDGLGYAQQPYLPAEEE